MAKHKNIPVRIYDQQDAHQPRVNAARDLIMRYMTNDIMELGCGAGDISGPFASDTVSVVGYDVNDLAIEEAKSRFPKGCFMTGNLMDVEPTKTGLLVLCEVLEHLPAPFDLTKKWMPLCDYVLISHPLDEPVKADMSAGEHQWAFSRSDFDCWFSDNGYELLEEKTGPLGGYTYIVGIGRRRSI